MRVGASEDRRQQRSHAWEMPLIHSALCLVRCALGRRVVSLAAELARRESLGRRQRHNLITATISTVLLMLSRASFWLVSFQCSLSNFALVLDLPRADKSTWIVLFTISSCIRAWVSSLPRGPSLVSGQSTSVGRRREGPWLYQKTATFVRPQTDNAGPT